MFSKFFNHLDFVNGSDKFVIHDVTALVHPKMPLWPGESHTYEHKYAKSFMNGDTVCISRISCSMHTGTHIDAPYHKIGSGKKLDELPVERFMGIASIYDLTHVEYSITLDDVNDLDFRKGSICLFKTKNSGLWASTSFDPNFVYIDAEAATHLVAHDVKVVGIDYLSVDAFQAELSQTHKVFFDADVLIYEGLDLRDIEEGTYYFIGLPLRIHNAEASLVRVILIGEKEGRV